MTAENDVHAVPAEHRRFFHGLNVAGVLLFIAVVMFVFRASSASTEKSSLSYLPVSIRATSQADYSSDPHGLTIPAINENIINQLIADVPATGSPQDRIATLQAGLVTPVPTMTANSQTATPTKAIAASPTISTSITPIGSATPRVSPSPTPASVSTTIPTVMGTATPPSLLPTLPPLLPTNLPILPVIPTIIAIPSALPPIIPTILPLPTLPPILPTLPPLPTIDLPLLP